MGTNLFSLAEAAIDSADSVAVTVAEREGVHLSDVRFCHSFHLKVANEILESGEMESVGIG